VKLIAAALLVARAAHADCTPLAAVKVVTGATIVEFGDWQPSGRKPAGAVAVAHGVLTTKPATYDPRTECEMLDDEIADGKRDLPAEREAAAGLTGKEREQADDVVKRHELKLAEAKRRQESCHPTTHARPDPREIKCRSNAMEKDCD